MTVGIDDNFSATNDPELSSPSTALQNWVNSNYSIPGNRGFDNLQNDRFFAHTFEGLDQTSTGASLVGATLQFRAKAGNSSQSYNDAIGLLFVQNNSSSTTWYSRLGTNSEAAGLVIGEWTPNRVSDFNLNLNSLSGGVSLISQMQSYGKLDLYIQDDTGVDYLRLNVAYNGDRDLSNPHDIIVGFGSNDTLRGFTGDDYIAGDDGNDYIDGGTGNDFLDGGIGVDTLIGGTGNDYLNGGTGNDYLLGGTGSDNLTGGLGNDIFNYNTLGDSLFSNPSTIDKITDYSVGDQLNAPVGVFGATLTSNVGNVNVALSAASIASVLNNITFGANTAKSFTATGYNGTFVAFNNATAGFNPTTDSIIFLEGYNVSGATPIVII
jgi:Ca2+-binding RTX toxin-like protein